MYGHSVSWHQMYAQFVVQVLAASSVGVGVCRSEPAFVKVDSVQVRVLNWCRLVPKSCVCCVLQAVAALGC
jgi:hypothetical protein